MYIKKVLLVLAMLTVLLMTGCSKDEKNENNVEEENNQNQQQEQIETSDINYQQAYSDFLKRNEFSIEGFSWGKVTQNNVPDLIIDLAGIPEIEGGIVILSYENGTVSKREADIENESDRNYVFNESSIVPITYDDLLNILNFKTNIHFVSILENLYYNHVLPDGTELTNMDNENQLAKDKFAIFDIDFDGRDELIFSYNSGSMADIRDFIFDYDSAKNEVIEEAVFNPIPGTIYYDNGIVYETAKHNQGNEDPWPYTLYKYSAKTDRYENIDNSVEIKGNEINVPLKDFTKTNIDLLKGSIIYYNSIIDGRGSEYNATIMPKNVLLNGKLTRDGNIISLRADIGNPLGFSLEKIKKAVNNLESSSEREAKLDDYTIHKDYIEGFYRWYIGDFGLEYEFVDESFDKTKWYNEDRIPYYITDSQGTLVKLEYKNGYYYPYSSSVPIGDIALIDDIKENAFELVLNDNDEIVLVHGNNIDKVLSEKTYTAKELFEHESSPIIGTSYYNDDSFEIKDGAIYLYVNDGGGN